MIRELKKKKIQAELSYKHLLEPKLDFGMSIPVMEKWIIDKVKKFIKR